MYDILYTRTLRYNILILIGERDQCPYWWSDAPWSAGGACDYILRPKADRLITGPNYTFLHEIKKNMRFL